MNLPDLNRMVETFIPIAATPADLSQRTWQAYLDMLRSKVAPLVRGLMRDGLISWYSFLVHDRAGGVPTAEDDHGVYLHLRMGVLQESDAASVIRRLPGVCVMTRQIPAADLPSLGWVDTASLVDSRVEQGWRILGESSEWVLSMLDAHASGRPIPAANVAQFLHYLGNQLLVGAVRIPMP